MESPAKDIATLLEDSTTGLTQGTDLFITPMPPLPDKCVSVIDSVGFAPDPRHGIYYPGIQLLVRGDKRKYSDAYALAESCRELLHGQTELTINSTRYMQILAVTDTNFLFYDENERPVFAINFNIQRT